MTSLALTPAAEQADLVRRGELAATRLLSACLDRYHRWNPTVNAVVTLNPRAEEEAFAIDRAVAEGRDPGPLAGLPVGIKDVTETAGIRTTYGSPLFRDHVPAEDALVVRRLRDAGAVILGKTNTPEYAAGGNTWNDIFGRTRNPWDPGRSAGGSTGGGGAALATGMISLAHGTDLGGSLRTPASFCGVLGLRPSAGLIPTVPSPYPWDHLEVTGVMARTATDIGRALDSLAGPDPGSPVLQSVEGRSFETGSVANAPPKLAWVPDIAGIGIDAAVARVCEDALTVLRDSGATIETVDIDLSDARDAFLALRGHWFVARLFEGLDRIDDYGVNVAANLRAGLEVTPRQLGEAERVRLRVRETLRAALEDHDGLVSPCAAVSPFPVEQNFPETIGGRPMETYIDWIAPTFVLSLSGLPVASVPCGLDEGGLPVGLQIVGPPAGEEAALAVSGWIAEARAIGSPPIENTSAPASEPA